MYMYMCTVYTSHRATTRYHHYLLAREITEGYVMYSITRKQREVTGRILSDSPCLFINIFVFVNLNQPLKRAGCENILNVFRVNPCYLSGYSGLLTDSSIVELNPEYSAVLFSTLKK